MESLSFLTPKLRMHELEQGKKILSASARHALAAIGPRVMNEPRINTTACQTDNKSFTVNKQPSRAPSGSRP
jgi:hypothetical protein